MHHIMNHYHFLLTHTDIFLLGLAFVWELIWKGFALWRAGRNNQPVWFVVLLIVNSFGLLEIIYLLAFQRNNSASAIKPAKK